MGGFFCFQFGFGELIVHSLPIQNCQYGIFSKHQTRV